MEVFTLPGSTAQDCTSSSRARVWGTDPQSDWRCVCDHQGRLAVMRGAESSAASAFAVRRMRFTWMPREAMRRWDSYVNSTFPSLDAE